MIDKLRISKVLAVTFNVIYGIIVTIGLAIGIYSSIKYKNLEKSLLYYNIYFPIEETLYTCLLIVSSIGIFLIILSTYVFRRNNTRIEKCIVFLILFYCVMKLFFGYATVKNDFYPSYHRFRIYQIFDNWEHNTIQPYLEEEYECCGFDGPPDYHQFMVLKYPNSCYKNTSDTGKGLQENCTKIIQHPIAMRHAGTYLTYFYKCCEFNGSLNYSDLESVKYPDTCYSELFGIKKLKEDGCAEKVKNQYLLQIKGVYLVFVVSGTLEILGYMITSALLDTIRISRNATVTV